MCADSLTIGKRCGIVLGSLTGLSFLFACVSAPTPRARGARPPLEPSVVELAKLRRHEARRASPPVVLDDAQIVEVARAFDAIELLQARLAENRGHGERVRTLAKDMLHRGGHLSSGGARTHAKSRVADDLRAHAERNLRRLERARAGAFDREFIEAQIDQHRAMLDKLNSHLIPMATTPTLRNALEEARTLVEDHLSQATAALWSSDVTLVGASAGLP